jgi:hypothetical protein
VSRAPEILALLSEGPMTLDELAAELSLPRAQVEQLLPRLRDRVCAIRVEGVTPLLMLTTESNEAFWSARERVIEWQRGQP